MEFYLETRRINSFGFGMNYNLDLFISVAFPSISSLLILCVKS